LRVRDQCSVMGSGFVNLLILDIDETLLYATKKKLQRDCDLVVGPYNIYLRPHLSRFLRELADYYELAVWTSSGSHFAEAVVAQLPFHVQPSFVWSRNRCTQKTDWETRERIYIKDLKKVKRLGYELGRILIVDDSPEKIYRSYGNHIHVQPFSGDPNDSELYLLEKYLISIAGAENVRSMEKRFWRSQYRI